MKQILISILIRTYNAAQFVDAALGSALFQTFNKGRYEILVADDGSTDDTLVRLERYGNRIRVLRNKHIGPIPLINMGLRHARGDHVLLLDSDDVLKSRALETLYAAYLQSPHAAFVYSDYTERDMKGRTIDISVGDNIFNTLACGILFKKDVLFSIGYYDETLIFPEYDVLIKMDRIGYRGAYVSTSLYEYRRRGASITGNRETVERGREQLRKRYGTEFPIRSYLLS
ncbi:MAG: glycosyltransferase family 2 protein [Patescibacteria group bacterium]|nr:glycosyltransferase family 2 protein [Patescibacteria group bacterium]MDE2438449.1 glycosyltransferase family 2 protein [Patescibacteria group bacterium]